MNKAIFFDRDGVLIKTNVINGKPYAVRTLEEFNILDDAYHIVNNFKSAGYLIFVITNQPDVGNGYVMQKTVEDMHNLLTKALPLDAIAVCYHRQDFGCECRKPKPGMILSLAKEFNVDLSFSILVGDRPQDIDAGHRAGLFTVLINCNYKEEINITPHLVINKLSELTIDSINMARLALNNNN